MAIVPINIPDEIAPRVLNGMAARHGYNAATDGTKLQFYKQLLIRWTKSELREHEANTAGAAASAAASTAAESEITIT